MRKNIVALLMALFAVTLLYGCGSEAAEDNSEEKIAVVSPNPTVSDVLEERTSEGASSDISVPQPDDEKEIVDESTDATSIDVPLPDDTIDESMSLSSIEGVDIDLSSLSSTVVYAQVYNMMYYPENFVGKTIRMEGLYSDYFDQAKGKHYFACIIMDATACCSQGVEFELTDEYVYPDDYPGEGDTVTVEGVFEIYEEDGYNYCTLRNAKFIES